MSSIIINQENKLDYDKACYAFGCYNKSTEKIKVSAGTFGSITLNLCSKCIDLFQNNETSSSLGDFQD